MTRRAILAGHLGAGLMADDVPGVHGIFHGHEGTPALVVIDPFNVKRAGSFKPKNDAAPVGSFEGK